MTEYYKTLKLKKIYSFKVKDGAFTKMSKVLNYPEQVDYRMDNTVCRITVTTYTITDNVKKEFQNELLNDRIYQIKIAGINEREFMILESLLESIDGMALIEE